MRPYRLTLPGEAFLSAGVRKFFRQSSGYASGGAKARPSFITFS
jgi:hypothetical protein